MGHGGGTGEHLEKVAVKAGNYTPVADEFDLWVARIVCFGLVYFQHHYVMLPHCHLGLVVSQTAHQLEPYWLSSVGINSSTLYVTKETVLNN
jgi:hypothetical protein